MGKYAFFIIAAYGVAGFSIAGLIAFIVLDYRRLRKALAKFPSREGDERE